MKPWHCQYCCHSWMVQQQHPIITGSFSSKILTTDIPELTRHAHILAVLYVFTVRLCSAVILAILKLMYSYHVLFICKNWHKITFILSYLIHRTHLYQQRGKSGEKKHDIRKKVFLKGNSAKGLHEDKLVSHFQGRVLRTIHSSEI